MPINIAAVFEFVRFDGPARFVEARFNDHAVFTGAVFGDDVTFGSTRFGGVVSFDRAAFDGAVTFDKAHARQGDRHVWPAGWHLPRHQEDVEAESDIWTDARRI